MKKVTKDERRKHKRYLVKNRIFAVVRSQNHRLHRISNLSKGEIAFAIIRSNPPKMGEIKEISQNGLSFHYINKGSNQTQYKGQSKMDEMDILFVDENFHLRRIPFKIIGDTAIPKDGPFSTLAMNRLTVQFEDLTVEQMNLLNHMIQNFTTGEVPLA